MATKKSQFKSSMIDAVSSVSLKSELRGGAVLCENAKDGEERERWVRKKLNSVFHP